MCAKVSSKLVAMCLCIALLSGCAILASPTPEPVTISFAHFSMDTGHYEELIPLFNEQYPHITVELNAIRYQTAFERLEESESDVFDLYPPFLIPAYEQGALLVVTPFVEGDKAFNLEDFYPGALDLVTVDGEMQGIPSAIECGVMAYNKDLFDTYGVPYPENGWTWDDFLAAAAGVTDSEGGVYGFAPQVLDPMYFKYMPHWIDPLPFVYQHGGRLFDDWKNPTRTTFDDPLTIEAVEWYAKLFYKHHVAPTQAEARQLYTVDGRGYFIFAGAKAGMMIAGISDRFPNPGGGKAIHRGIVALPRGQHSAAFCLSTVYAISAKTEHPEASWQWIAFLSRQMPRSWMPARRSLLESDAYRDEVGEEVAAVARAVLDSEVILPFYMEKDRLEEIERFYDAVLAICEGEATTGEALFEAQQASRMK